MLFPAEFIARHGTEFDPWPREDSLAYTRWLAGAYYENFHVVSLLLPRRLHQDFFNVYAFCRWADDLGDEMGSPERSLELLAWWRTELEAMYAGKTRHPVFVALSETIERHGIEQQPFADLIRAFVQDQRVSRYETYGQVLDYCLYSANPVGRLVLHLGGYTDDDRRRLSDATCTALQLANHWQDVRRDFEERDRIYLPADSMARHGYGYEALTHDIAAGRSSDGFRSLMAELVDRAEALFEEGSPLVDTLDRRLAIDVELFSRGGLAVLAAIRRQNYDVLARRPKVGKLTRARLLVATVARQLGPSNATVSTNPSAQ